MVERSAFAVACAALPPLSRLCVMIHLARLASEIRGEGGSSVGKCAPGCAATGRGFWDLV